jgi:hypothetical protein
MIILDGVMKNRTFVIAQISHEENNQLSIEEEKFKLELLYSLAYCSGATSLLRFQSREEWLLSLPQYVQVDGVWILTSSLLVKFEDFTELKAEF